MLDQWAEPSEVNGVTILDEKDHMRVADIDGDGIGEVKRSGLPTPSLDGGVAEPVPTVDSVDVRGRERRHRFLDMGRTVAGPLTDDGEYDRAEAATTILDREMRRHVAKYSTVSVFSRTAEYPKGVKHPGLLLKAPPLLALPRATERSKRVAKRARLGGRQDPTMKDHWLGSAPAAVRRGGGGGGGGTGGGGVRLPRL